MAKISRATIYEFETYERTFNELLNQGHTWINLHFAGIINNDLFIIVELPNYKNNTPRESVSVNLSLPVLKTIENNWNASLVYEIIES